MEIKYHNIQEEIQGNWACTDVNNLTKEEKLDLEFSLLISENIISRNGEGGLYWPDISNFELVGSNKDGYFYREDGCFIQVKSIINDELIIELHIKDSNAQLNTLLFTFKKKSEE